MRPPTWCDLPTPVTLSFLYLRVLFYLLSGVLYESCMEERVIIRSFPHLPTPAARVGDEGDVLGHWLAQCRAVPPGPGGRKGPYYHILCHTTLIQILQMIKKR
jgi:hypothetical protein